MLNKDLINEYKTAMDYYNQETALDVAHREKMNINDDLLKNRLGEILKRQVDKKGKLLCIYFVNSLAYVNMEDIDNDSFGLMFVDADRTKELKQLEDLSQDDLETELLLWSEEDRKMEPSPERLKEYNEKTIDLNSSMPLEEDPPMSEREIIDRMLFTDKDTNVSIETPPPSKMTANVSSLEEDLPSHNRKGKRGDFGARHLSHSRPSVPAYKTTEDHILDKPSVDKNQKPSQVKVAPSPRLKGKELIVGSGEEEFDESDIMDVYTELKKMPLAENFRRLKKLLNG